MSPIDPPHRKKSATSGTLAGSGRGLHQFLIITEPGLTVRPSGSATSKQALGCPKRGLLTPGGCDASSIIFICAASSESVSTARRALPLLPYSQSA